jgi:hypothetical protein
MIIDGYDKWQNLTEELDITIPATFQFWSHILFHYQVHHVIKKTPKHHFA